MVPSRIAGGCLFDVLVLYGDACSYAGMVPFFGDICRVDSETEIAWALGDCGSGSGCRIQDVSLPVWRGDNLWREGS